MRARRQPAVSAYQVLEYVHRFPNESPLLKVTSSQAGTFPVKSSASLHEASDGHKYMYPKPRCCMFPVIQAFHIFLKKT